MSSNIEKLKELIQEGENMKQHIYSPNPQAIQPYTAWCISALILIEKFLPSQKDQFEKLQVEIVRFLTEKQVSSFTSGGVVNYRDDKSQLLFSQQLGILQGINASAFLDIEQSIRRDLSNEDLQKAQGLLDEKVVTSNQSDAIIFIRAAGVVAGVVLESYILQVCQNHNIKTKKSFNDNIDLLKTSTIIDNTKHKELDALYSIRTKCAHPKSQDPTIKEVQKLIDGAEEVLRTIS